MTGQRAENGQDAPQAGGTPGPADAARTALRDAGSPAGSRQADGSVPTAALPATDRAASDVHRRASPELREADSPPCPQEKDRRVPHPEPQAADRAAHQAVQAAVPPGTDRPAQGIAPHTPQDATGPTGPGGPGGPETTCRPCAPLDAAARTLIAQDAAPPASRDGSVLCVLVVYGRRPDEAAAWDWLCARLAEAERPASRTAQPSGRAGAAGPGSAESAPRTSAVAAGGTSARLRLDHLLVHDNSPVADWAGLEPGPGLTLSHDPTNGGTVAAYRAAAALARQRGHDWVLLLDHDTHLPADYLDRLGEMIEAESASVGMPDGPSFGAHPSVGGQGETRNGPEDESSVGALDEAPPPPASAGAGAPTPDLPGGAGQGGAVGSHGAADQRSARRASASRAPQAVVPQVHDAGRLVSPAWCSARVGLTPSARPGPREAGGFVTAISSGALLRPEVLSGAEPFAPGMWLDYVDHWIFLALDRAGGRVAVADTVIDHALSVMDPAGLSPRRVASILAGESALARRLGLRARAALPLRRLVRAARLARVNPAAARQVLAGLVGGVFGGRA